MYKYFFIGHHGVSASDGGRNMKMCRLKLNLLCGVMITLIIQLLLGGSAEAVEALVINPHQHVRQPLVVTANPHQEELRLRVIANSDESFDQVVKKVAVLAVEQQLNVYDGADLGLFARENLPQIKLAIEEVFTEIGVETAVEVSFGKHFFPASNGYFESLVVRLGTGQGENWWCFINPGVCRVPTETKDSVNSAQVATTSEIQESLTERTLSFIGGLFNRDQQGGERAQTTVTDTIDWFAFSDERP